MEKTRRNLLCGIVGLSFLIMSNKTYALELNVNFSLEDLIIAAKTLWGEARGDTVEGRLAVAHVFMNRWRSTKGQWAKDDTLAKTCLRPWQFSAWNSNDPNLPKMQQVDMNNKQFRECMQLVLEAYNYPERDPTSNSRHYATINLINKGWPRSWGKPQNPVFTIDSHHFYNNIP